MANRVSQWFRKLSGHHAHHHHRKMTREDFQKLPRHVAIIMDGNGRWAKQHRLNVAMGHRQGTETLREIIRHTDDLKIEALSIYAFSTENWKRSKEEVGALMQLILDFFASEIDELDEKNVRMCRIGLSDYRIEGFLNGSFRIVHRNDDGNRSHEIQFVF